MVIIILSSITLCLRNPNSGCEWQNVEIISNPKNLTGENIGRDGSPTTFSEKYETVHKIVKSNEIELIKIYKLITLISHFCSFNY